MKKLLLLIAVLPLAAFAQDGTLVDPTNSQTRQTSAALEVYSTNQGFLSPRVALTSTADAATVTGTEPNGLLVYNTATAGDVTPGFYYWTGSAWSRLLNGATNLSGSGTTNYLARWTPNGNTLGIGVTYDNGTNVGISSTSPGAKLDVASGDIRVATDNNALLLGSTAATQYALHNYTTNSLWLQNNGNTTSNLVVATAFDWDRQIAIQYTPGTTGAIAGDLQIGQLNKNNANFTHGITRFYTNGAERLRITSNGNVGINSTAPGAKLDVNGGNVRITSAGDAKFEYFGSGSDRGFVGWQASAPAGVYLWNRDNSPLYFGTTNAERMRIDLSGNVGINQTSPTVKLQVGGEIMRTNTRVNSTQRYPVAHATQGDDLLGIDPTWTNAELQAYFNSANVQWSADATAPSGYAIQITGAVNVGGDYNSGFPYIPIENGASYYMECWIRSSAANVGHYMGSIEYNENFAGGSGNPGSYGYWVMSNTLPGTSWVKVSGTISGFGSSVGQFQTGKKYWTPQALFNYTNGGGATTYISGWKVVKIASGITTPSLATNYIQNQITSAQTSANYWISGTGRAAAFQLNNANTSLTEGSGDALRMTTPTGYIDIGSQNASWAHIQTDRPRYYFNVGGTFDSGLIGSYDEDLSLQTSGTTRITALNANGNVGINATAPSARFHVAGGGQILGTNGTSSNTRTLTILEDGDAQINFGSYPGAWTSALQIQDNTTNRFIWISPLDNGSGQNARFITAGSGLDIFTSGSSGSSGTFTARFEANSGVGLLNMGSVSNAGSASDPSVNQGNNWITWGYRADNNPYYCIRTQYKTYGSYTYSRLQLNWHTGIEIGAEKTYGGTRFFNNSPGMSATQIMSIGDGDDHVRVNNYLFAAYLNSTDNSVSSGVTGVMVKAGDNYFRTGTAAAVASFLGTSLAGNYIQNQVSSAQSGNYWITGEARTNDWFRNMNNNTGLYNQANGLHWYSEGNSYWGTTTTGAGGIIFRDGHLGTVKGYVYQNDAGSFGLLSPDGNWKVRVDNGAIELYNTTYSPFIYDRDNTGYYWDGNSTSRMYYGDFNYLHTQVNDSWFPYTGNNWNYFRGNTYAWNATWYDENNTGYFIDPASTSRFYNINTLPGFDGYYPSNNVIRHTPNLHFNSLAGYAVIVNWDNGTSGASQTFRTTGDGFYVYADGQTFCSNWFRPLGTSGLYFQSYGGGWHMTDATWIRAYNSKPILATGGVAGYGNGAFGTPFNGNPRIYANYDNVNAGGIAISDDGGFYDFNDGWIQSRFSNGQDMRSNNATWNTIFTMGNQDNSGLNDKYVASRNDNWGLIGASGNAWWRGYSYGWVTSSQREKKKQITAIEGDLATLVMADLEKMKPSFYKYKVETDEYDETKPFKYRPNMHLGLILEESPDYLQDEQFTGIDNYSAATLGILAGKINNEEIKKLKKNVQDFGSVDVTTTTLWVNFSEEFATAISGSSLPVVTVTANKEGIVANIVEKSTTGFKVKVNKLEPELVLDFIAMGKAAEKEISDKIQNNISPELMKGLRVDESVKEAQRQRIIKLRTDQEEREKQAKIDGERIHQQRLKELALPEGYIGPDKTPVHDPKLNDADALIKEHNEKLKQQQGGPAPATTPQINEKAAEDLKNYKQIPADAPMKEASPAEFNLQNNPR
ncbi:MAG: hypothetical protein POELPBGB_03441 [Bacteroidia bacterium]|nr:hypothetical protein [Bacteroidia bacterium]